MDQDQITFYFIFATYSFNLISDGYYSTYRVQINQFITQYKAISALHHLQTINLTRCSGISDIGVRLLVDGPSGSQLKKLILVELTQLTDISLLRMSQRCHSLLELDVSYCHNLTDSGFELLPALRNLKFWFLFFELKF